MHKVAILVAGLLLVSLDAQATEKWLGDKLGAESCFVRTYSAAHLARNPQQRTLAMRIALRRELIPGSVGLDPLVFLRLETIRRGDKRKWKAIAGCGYDEQANYDETPGSPTFGKLRNPAYPHKDAIACQVTGDTLDSEGGDFLLEDVVGGMVVYINDSITMRTGNSVRADKGRLIEFGGEDGVFSLDRAPNAACADLQKALRFE